MTDPAASLVPADLRAALTAILCEILVLNPEDVQPGSKLVDDLDADSIAFLELTFRIESDFGLEVPQAKVDEQTLSMSLPDGAARLKAIMGGSTLFEFMEAEAGGGGLGGAMGLLGGANPAPLTIGALAALAATSVPKGYDPEASTATLRLRELFRFITVESYVRYIQHLADAQARIKALGGAEAMNAEAAARLRAAKTGAFAPGSTGA